MDLLSRSALMTTGLVGFLTAIIVYFIYKHFFNHYWRLQGIPYVKSVPFLGNVFEVIQGKPYHIVDQESYKKYKHGKIYGAYEGTNPVLFVADPVLIKDIWVTDFSSFVNKRSYNTGDAITDCMVTNLRDDGWKRVRSILTPFFAAGKLKGMMTTIADHATHSTNNFLQYADSNQPAECKTLFSNFTLDVIADVAFGVELDSHKDPNNIFVTSAKEIFNQDLDFPRLVAVYSHRLGALLGVKFFNTKFFVELAKQVVETRIQTKETRNDFLQILLEKLDDQEKVGTKINLPDDLQDETKSAVNSEDVGSKPSSKDKKTLSMVEVMAQTIVFFLAGYDTTSTALAMICYNLAHNRDVQKKLQQEIDEIWEKTTAVDAVSNRETKYMDAVIKESLRLFPPGVRPERMAGRDYPLGNTGFVIPKGMLVGAPMYSIHRDPEYFDEPEKFKPDRFLEENESSLIPFTYLPFGAGPRGCIAMKLAEMEIKIHLMHLMKEVEFELSPQTKSPPDYYNGFPLLQPKAVYLKVTRRSKSQ